MNRLGGEDTVHSLNKRWNNEETAPPNVTTVGVNPTNNQESYWKTTSVEIAVVNTRRKDGLSIVSEMCRMRIAHLV